MTSADKKSTHSWTRRALAILAVLASVWGLTVPTASAHNYVTVTGYTGCAVNVTDDANISFYYTSATMSSAAMRDALLWTRQNNLDPTLLSTTGYGTWDGSLTQRDIIGYSSDWSGLSNCYDDAGNRIPWCCESGSTGLAAAAWVQATNSSYEAEQHRLYFDVDVINGATTNYVRALACHETGHTVGALHGGLGCLTDPATQNERYFTVDQVGHINNHFG